MRSLVTDDDLWLIQSAPEYFDRAMACWFSLPRAVEIDGRTWIGGVQPATLSDDDIGDPAAYFTPAKVVHPGGDIVAFETGVPTRHRVDTGPSDDHNNPAFLLRDDKPPVLFSSRHNGDDEVHYRVGTTPLDLSTLGPIQLVDFAAVGGGVSYSQVWSVGDVVLLLTRATPSAWAVSVSTDFCATWSAPVRLLDYAGSQCYVLSHQSGSTVHCMTSALPGAGDQQSIWYLAIDPATGDVTHADGTVLGNLDGTGLPLVTGDLDLVATVADADHTWIQDIGPDGDLLWAEWAADLSAAVYRWAAHDGSWTVADVVATGGPWATDGSDPTYQGGGCFDTVGDLFLSRGDTGVWSIERWTRTGSVWSQAETVASSTERRLVRPYCPAGRTTGPRVVWNTVDRYPAWWQFRADTDWETETP